MFLLYKCSRSHGFLLMTGQNEDCLRYGSISASGVPLDIICQAMWQNIFILIIFTAHKCAYLCISHAKYFRRLANGDTVLLADFYLFCIGNTLCTVMKKTCSLCFFHVISVTHRQSSAGVAYPQRMLITVLI